MKKCVAIFVVVVLCLSLCACSADLISGTYVSQSGVYTVEFQKNGTCTWYQNGSFFDGTYQKTENGWQLNVSGSGFYSNTVFDAVEDGENLIITGGKVEGELFIRQ